MANEQQQGGGKNDLDVGGWGGSSPSWFTRNFRNVVLPIIVLVIVLGGLYLYNRDTGEEPTISEEETPGIGLVTTPTPTASPAPGQDAMKKTAPAPRMETTPEVRDSNYLIKAAKGDGVTHLARRTLRTYLAEEAKDTALSPEQKIYAEDYLKDRTSRRRLEVGEEITFSKSLVQEAVTEAQKLTDAQKKSLSRYVPLVPSLQ